MTTGSKKITPQIKLIKFLYCILYFFNNNLSCKDILPTIVIFQFVNLAVFIKLFKFLFEIISEQIYYNKKGKEFNPSEINCEN